MDLANEEMEHWVGRYNNCFPATYPPELWVEKEYEYTTGTWPFKKVRTYTRGVCKLCGKRLMTAHRCNFISEHMKKETKNE